MSDKIKKPTKRQVCIALFNRELHKDSLCPGNYQVDYERGWFTVQYGTHAPSKVQRPALTAEADQILRDNSHEIVFSSSFNTYLLQS